MKYDMKKHWRTYKGFLTQTYSGQRARSKRRLMIPPDYSKKDLDSWLNNQTDFKSLWNSWIDSGYRQTKITRTTISGCCSGRYKTAGGFKFKYKL